jgi:hypothetical protein
MRTIITLIAVLTLPLTVGSDQAHEPQAGHCVTVRPICGPGQHPVCVCPTSYNCGWMCTR